MVTGSVDMTTVTLLLLKHWRQCALSFLWSCITHEYFRGNWILNLKIKKKRKKQTCIVSSTSSPVPIFYTDWQFLHMKCQVRTGLFFSVDHFFFLRKFWFSVSCSFREKLVYEIWDPPLHTWHKPSKRSHPLHTHLNPINIKALLTIRGCHGRLSVLDDGWRGVVNEGVITGEMMALVRDLTTV